ncbi:hypothetical protein ABFS82_06G170600 [Erythranthe guttata]
MRKKLYSKIVLLYSRVTQANLFLTIDFRVTKTLTTCTKQIPTIALTAHKVTITPITWYWTYIYYYCTHSTLTSNSKYKICPKYELHHLLCFTHLFFFFFFNKKIY